MELISLAELQQVAKELGLPKFTAGQMADWLYKKEILTIEEMTNLSLKARELLNEKYEFGLTNYVNNIDYISHIESVKYQKKSQSS